MFFAAGPRFNKPKGGADEELERSETFAICGRLDHGLVECICAVAHYRNMCPPADARSLNKHFLDGVFAKA